MSVRRVAVVMPDDFSLWQPRRGLLSLLVESGFEVDAISAPGRYVDKVRSLGVRHIGIPVTRTFDPIADARLLVDLYRLFRAGRYDVVHCLNTKMNIYGTVAARLAGVKRVFFNVDGLGQAFSDHGTGARWPLPAVVSALYFVAGHLADRVRFMNEDDLDFFVSRRFVTPAKAVLIRGEGVDLSEYQIDRVDPERIRSLRRRLALDEQSVVIAMISRMIWGKGVREFVDASAVVRESQPNAVFVLVGATEPNPDAVPEDYLREAQSRGIQWLGFWDDLSEIFAVADIVVLPSYLREGVPNTLIEAMAMGRPLITTDNAGCREVVEDGRNGYLVPVRDSAALARAIGQLAADPQKRIAFGRESRRIAVERFDQRRMFGRILRELYRIDASESPA